MSLKFFLLGWSGSGEGSSRLLSGAYKPCCQYYGSRRVDRRGRVSLLDTADPPPTMHAVPMCCSLLESWFAENASQAVASHPVPLPGMRFKI